MTEEELKAKIGRMKVLILDVDGVMTDGGIILGDGGLEFKVFDAKDGHGIKLAQRAGIEVAIITGRNSESVASRARELDIKLLYQGTKKKTEVFDEILQTLGIGAPQAAYMGDDLVDLPVMKKAGLAIAVADAHPEVTARADLVTSRPGGKGAVREAIETILKTRGDWKTVTAPYLGNG